MSDLQDLPSTRPGDVGEGVSTKALLRTQGGLAVAPTAAMITSHLLGAREARVAPELGQKIRDESPINMGVAPVAAYVQKGQLGPGATKPAIQDRVVVPPALKQTGSILGHELGHHEIAQHPLGRLIQNPTTVRAGRLAPMAGMAGGFASGFTDDERVRRGAVLAPLALSAPQLAHEAIATGLGLRRMRRAGGSWRDVARGLGTVLPAQSTYGMQAAHGVTGALLGQRAGTFIRNAREANAEKEAGLRENFFDKVEKKDGKWEWTAAVNSDGYPKIKDDGKLRLASHVALELAGREPPRKGQVAMHRDNDLANIHPSNLRVGTQAQNLKMMRDQGRDRPRGVDQEPDDPKYREKKGARLAGLLEGMERAAG